MTSTSDRMDHPLDIYQMRVEAARMGGEMDDYVRDVQALLTALRYSIHKIEHYERSSMRARTELSIMRQQADMRDTAETRAADYQLMIAGAERIAHAFDGEDEG